MTFTPDEAYMRMALSIAEDGLGRVWPNPSVGCVIVQGGVAVGYGRTADNGRPHAEAAALTMAGDKAKGATVYVTLEPCAERGRDESCSDKLIAAGVSRVVVACLDINPVVYKKGIAKLEAAGIEVEVGLYEQHAVDSHIGFFHRIQKKRPFVVLKQAVSVDGMVAALKSHRPGQRTYISGPQAREYVHELRATFDAVAVGIHTVLSDDPLLTVRLDGHEHRIVRVVFDSHLRIPVDSRLVQSASDDPLLILHNTSLEREEGFGHQDGVELLRVGASARSALEVLANYGITRLLVEGGPTLHGALIAEGLVDEAHVLKSKIVLGEDGLAGVDVEALGFECVEKRDLGEDLLEVYRPEV